VRKRELAAHRVASGVAGKRGQTNAGGNGVSACATLLFVAHFMNERISAAELWKGRAMKPVHLTSDTPGSGESRATSHAPTLNTSDSEAPRSRERTYAIPLKSTNSAIRTKRRVGASRSKRLSRSKRAMLSRPLRSRSAQLRSSRAALAATEGIEERKPVDVTLEVHRGHAEILDTSIPDATDRIQNTIISPRIELSRRRKTPLVAHTSSRRRLLPSWMWISLNVLAIILIAFVFIASETDSSAINKAITPLFQAFTGALPNTFDTAGPTPHPVRTQAAFVATMLPYARHASQTLGWPVSVILAQWGVEHGWTLPDFDGWNVGNTKAFDSPTGVCYGAPVVRGFCAPKTPGAGLAIYIHGARLHYYSGIAVAARQGGPDAAARALGESPWDAGHYTTDNSPGDTLLRAMKAFNLYRYDKP
jgi:hypothetical protein